VQIVKMSIDLRSTNIGMAEEFHYDPDIRTGFEQVRRAGVPNDMRRKFFRQPAFFSVLSERFPETHPRESLPSGVQKEVGGTTEFSQLWPADIEILSYPSKSGLSKWHITLLVTFAHDAYHHLFREEIIDSKVLYLGDAQAARVPQL
jgi:hypothetical protein